MNSLAKESMNIAVESLKKISETDLADLCNKFKLKQRKNIRSINFIIISNHITF